VDLHELWELVLELLGQLNPAFLEQQGGAVYVRVCVVLQDLLLNLIIQELILLSELALNVLIIVLI